jgi:PAS domain S-box-containing protein
VLLATVLVVVAGVWIAAGHLVFGAVPLGFSLLEMVNDLLPILVLAVVGAIVGTRWSAEHARTLASLRESEERARDLVDQSADGILVSSKDGRYVEANPAMCRMLGYSRAELLSMHAGDLTADDDPVGNDGMDALLAGMTDATVLLVERRYRRRDGTSLPVEVKFTALADGRQQRSVRDISERVRAEAERIRLASAVEQTGDSVVITDLAGTIEYVNPAFERISGYGRDEAVGQNPRILNSGRQSAEFYRDLWGGLVQGTSWSGAIINRRQDGTFYEVEATFSPIRDPNGRVSGYVGVERDVTERERVRLERERLAAAVEQSLDAVLITDAASLVTYANPAFLAVTGRTMADLVNRPASEVAVEIMGSEDAAVFEQAAGRSEPVLHEVTRTARDGSVRQVQISMSPVRDPGGAVTSFVMVSRDVTPLREAQSELVMEAQISAAMAEGLRRIPPQATVNQAAQAMCDELATVPFIDVAAVELFLGPEDTRIVGLSAPDGYPLGVGDHAPPRRAAHVQAKTEHGPWAEYARVEPDGEDWVNRVAAAGLKARAYGPIKVGDELVGALVIGTYDQRLARTIVERIPSVVDFSTTPSALLAERLQALRREVDLRGAIGRILGSATFHPVFQPIVDLESRETVGFEALTRFDSGQRPDLCFADAWSVSLGADLELATLTAAVAAARELPPGLWLDLNVSPRLLGDPERLRTVLWSADRPIVLEVTEHEIIDDYDAVRDAIASLGHDVRLAVDDAGSGIANFGHIIDLRPDFVKLDISLVRRVNANLGRQALVVGMRHFARTAGCRLIAEGVETAEEARTLTALGVEFGQGYLFGHPEPVETWTAKAGRGGATDANPDVSQDASSEEA